MAGALALAGLAVRFGRLTVLRTAIFVRAVPPVRLWPSPPRLALAVPAFVAVGAAYICVLSGSTPWCSSGPRWRPGAAS